MADRPSVSISKICFSGGHEFSFGPKEKVILVGPNNSGKSQTLREILAIAQKGDKVQTVVVKRMELTKVGTSAELRAFLEQNAERSDQLFRLKNWVMNEGFINFWDKDYLLRDLAAGYIKIIGANDRLQICATQDSIGPNDQKSKPQHILYDDSKLMKKISGIFRQAFGQDIMFDFRGGRQIPIHVGEKPDENLTDRVGDEYVEAVRSNARLDIQGDGMKSYAGILFETVVNDLDINLLDEPEAFLHPPQIRRLGETLASEVRGQLFVATHNSDVLRGFLEGKRGDIRILRIKREGDVNLVSETDPVVAQELWKRPELRYSNALEGVFHDETIICEDDSDCRLLNAIADHLALTDEENWKDTAYVPSGGKHRIKKVANALREIGVSVKGVFDIDFLSDQTLVKDTVRAFGGKWEDFDALWGRVDAAVRKGVKPKSSAEIRAELIELIQNCDSSQLPRGKINEVLKQNSVWNILKKVGKAGIPSGKAQTNFAQLINLLKEIGIYVIEVGEIENFCRDLGGHGPKFVNNLLADISFADPRLQDLRSFVEHVHKGPHAPLGG